jgi:hypothetical protein
VGSPGAAALAAGVAGVGVGVGSPGAAALAAGVAVVGATCADDGTRDAACALARGATGVAWCEAASDAVSHLVAGAPLRPTLKFMLAVARGAWVLRPDWVWASLDAVGRDDVGAGGGAQLGPRWAAEADYEGSARRQDADADADAALRDAAAVQRRVGGAALRGVGVLVLDACASAPGESGSEAPRVIRGRDRACAPETCQLGPAELAAVARAARADAVVHASELERSGPGRAAAAAATALRACGARVAVVPTGWQAPSARVRARLVTALGEGPPVPVVDVAWLVAALTGATDVRPAIEGKWIRAWIGEGAG